MGCAGEIYVVYGVQVPASIVWDPGKEDDDDPIIYCVNGHNVATDEWKIDNYKEDHPDKTIPEIAFYTEFHGPGYGAAAMDEAKLSITILGDDAMGMGSRHFKERALVGFVVANECYLGDASACPPMDEIKAQGARLAREIGDKLGLDVLPSDFRLHLYFDSLNGM